MYRSPFLRVWALSRSLGHCKHCGRLVTWMITTNGKNIPLDGANPVLLKTERDPKTQLTIAYYDRAIVHFATCPKPPPRPAPRPWSATR